MKKISLKEAGYDTTRIWSLKRYKYLRCLLWCLLGLLVCAPFVYLSLDYLARLPRERATKNFSFWQRVQRGTLLTLGLINSSLESPEDDPKKSALPVFEIYIKGSRLDKLNARLPESGKTFQPANLRIKEKGKKKRSLDFKADVRYRGDSINHWAFPQKSWRVKIARGKYYNNVKVFNLYLPRTQNRVGDFLGYDMANQLGGLIVPEAYPVHFRLNRKFDGLRIFLEQPGQDLLINHGLPPGKLFQGDIGSIELYSNAPRHRLFNDPDGWEVSDPYDPLSEKKGIQDRREIKRLIDLLQEPFDPLSFYIKIQQLVDIEALLRYMALLEIVNSGHVDDTHNQKFYFNPVSGLLSPIVWDTVPYYWGHSTNMDLASNLLFRTVLQIPEFRRRKNQIIWEALQGNLDTYTLLNRIEQYTSAIRADVLASVGKFRTTSEDIELFTNSDWERGIKNLRSAIRERNDYLKEQLKTPKVVYDTRSQDQQFFVTVRVGSNSGLSLDTMQLGVAGKCDNAVFALERVGLDNKDARIIAIATNGEILFEPHDTLESWRAEDSTKHLVAKTGYYTYSVSSNSACAVAAIKQISGRNSVTNAPITLKQETFNKEELPALSRNWPISLQTHQKSRVLEGNVTISSDLILNQDEDLVIKAGTRISIAPQTSIVAKGGKVSINGTVESPVSIDSLEPEKGWGVFAIQSSPAVDISNLKLTGGTSKWLDGVFFGSSLGIYNSQATLNNCEINDSIIDSRYSRIKANNGFVQNNLGSRIRQIASIVELNNVEYRKLNPIFVSHIAEQSAVGSGPIETQEIKLLVEGIKDYDKVVKHFQHALEKIFSEKQLKKLPTASGLSALTVQDGEPSFQRDVFFDTSEDTLTQNNLRYFLRHNFDNPKNHQRTLQSPQRPDYWPVSAECVLQNEIQKTANGEYVYSESLFDYGVGLNGADKGASSPWPLIDYSTFAATGMFQGTVTLPGKFLASELNILFPQRQEYLLEPAIVALSEVHAEALAFRQPTKDNLPPLISVFIKHTEYVSVKEYFKGVLDSESNPDGKKKKFANLTSTLEVVFKILSADQNPKGEIGAAHIIENDILELIPLLEERLAKNGIKLVPPTREEPSLELLKKARTTSNSSSGSDNL